jgi:hypothetical protein
MAVNILPCDLRLGVIEYLDDVRAIGRLAKLSRSWNWVLADRNLWIKLSSREGVPLVEGEGRSVRCDFRILYPMTVGGVRPQDIGAIFGRVVTLPKMSPVVFDKIVASPEIRREFVIVNFPNEVEVSVGPERRFVLDEQGRLQRATGPIEAGVIVCSLSMHNMRFLCSGSFNSNSFPDAFEQCNNSLEAGCFVMRKEVPDDTRNKSWAEQKALLKSRGCVATPLEARTLFDLICIINTGRCFDGQQNPRTFVRAAPQTSKHLGNETLWPWAVGGFAPGVGLGIINYFYDYGSVGVAPCVSAEVLPVLGT